jgi:regulatory protein
VRSKPPKPEATALARALRLLARREHSRQELLQKLQLRGLNTATIEAALKELEQRGWLSEERFCTAYVNSRKARGLGPLRIMAELQARGIAASAARLAVEPAAPHWREQAVCEYRKHYGESVPENRLEYARRARYLAARGYTAELIRDICRHHSKSPDYAD